MNSDDPVTPAERITTPVPEDRPAAEAAPGPAAKPARKRRSFLTMSRFEHRLHAAITLLLVAGILVFGGLLVAGKLEVRAPDHEKDASGAPERLTSAAKDGGGDQKGAPGPKGGGGRPKGGGGRPKGDEGPAVLPAPAQDQTNEIVKTVGASFAVTYQLRDAHAIWCCVRETRSAAGTEVSSFSSGEMLSPGDRLTFIWLDSPLSHDRTDKEVPVGYWRQSGAHGGSGMFTVPGTMWQSTVVGHERRSAPLKAQAGETVNLCQFGVHDNGSGGGMNRDLFLSNKENAFSPLPVHPEGTPGCTVRWTLRLMFVNAADWNDQNKRAELARFYDGKLFVEGVREHLAQESVKHATQLLEKNKDDAAAHNELAWVLATSSLSKYRDGKRAVEHAARACELSKDPAYLRTLAAAYAEAGAFEKAVETEEKFLTDRRGADRWWHPVDYRLTLYKEHKAWRE
jgi:hypothetical protein